MPLLVELRGYDYARSEYPMIGIAVERGESGCESRFKKTVNLRRSGRPPRLPDRRAKPGRQRRLPLRGNGYSFLNLLYS